LIYLPVAQSTSSGYSLLARTRLKESRAAVADIRQTIRSVDAKLPLYGVHELREQIDQGISPERVLGFLSLLFSGLATLLCGIGIYGLIAYAVSRRMREIGVRLAIGAQKADVARMFLGESLALVAAGVAVGVPLAIVSARVLKSLLYGVAPADGWTMVSTVAVFLTAALAASALPVWKASRVDPVDALRYE
jgi:ABC-type antimicrobial peptide transport system permease subunit